MKTKGLVEGDVLPLLESGMSTNAVARQLDVSSRTISYWKKKLGIRLDCKRHNWRLIQKAHNDGASYRQLRSTFGVSTEAIRLARLRGDFVLCKRAKPTTEQIRGRKREEWARYNARKRYQTPADEDIKALQGFYARCPKGYEVDHKIPLSKGGLHSLSNLQYLPKGDNRRKGNKI